MILSNSEILKAIGKGLIVINPQPDVPTDAKVDSAFNTTSLDLRLGESLSVPKPGSPHAFDLRKGNIAPFLATNYRKIMIDQVGGYNLQPHQFALANTLESVKLSIVEGEPHYAARIEGRSSFARCGLVIHLTAPTIHAGWEGNITLELMNFGNNAICLYPGMYICQLIFEKVEGEIIFTPSQFHKQTNPEGKF